MFDYYKLQQLSDKVKSNTATQNEKDEYMLLLYNNGSITKNQYDTYIADKSSNESLGAAITIGGIILLGYLIGKLVGTDKD